MRRIGTIPTESQARVFRSYLLTLGIHADVDQGADRQWAIWVHEEDRLDEGTAELEKFLANPKNDIYQAGAKTGAEIEREKRKDEKDYRRRQVDLRTAWHKWNITVSPITTVLIIISVAATVLQHIPAVQAIYMQWFYMKSYVTGEYGFPYPVHPEPYSYEIMHGQLWRLITPAFIHASFFGGFSVLHILFNMYWLRDLGDDVEKVEGPWKYSLHLLLYAVFPSLLEFYLGGPLFGGMSGVVYGLFTYAWLVGYYTNEERYIISTNTVYTMGIWYLLCWTGLLGGIANWAHTGGIVMGALLATLRLRRIPFTRIRW